MHPLILIATAFALAMDAFAVSLGISLSLPRLTVRHVFRLSWHFGLFQALMTVAGWLAGSAVSAFVGTVGNLIAFLVLCALGIKMIAHPESASPARKYDPTRGASLVLLSAATSMDALAVGLSYALINVNMLIPSCVIGAVALICTVFGALLGTVSKQYFGTAAERIGGAILIAIGIRILIG